MVGLDLSASKVEAVKFHLVKCRECQQEYEAYVRSLEKTKEWLEEERQDWEEREWQQVIQNAVKQKKPAVSPFAPWPFKKAWAYSLMGVLAAALVFLLVIKPFYIQEGIAPGSEMFARSQAQLSGGVFQESPQEVVKMTMVLPETGQKIVWFFDKNFELEVKK
jgi:hypothetical protein